VLQPEVAAGGLSVGKKMAGLGPAEKVGNTFPLAAELPAGP